MITLRKIAGPQTEVRSGIIADTLSGSLNGSNKVFYTTYAYKPDRITIYYNGQALHPDYDFTQTGTNEITFRYIKPLPQENLRATYEFDGADYNPNRKGRVSLSEGDVSKTINFITTLSSASYNISIDLVSSDSNPSVYSWVIGQKTAGGFTVYFSGEIDSNNYILEWEIFI